MDLNEEAEKMNRGWLTLNIIWAVMMISLLVYIMVGLYMKTKVPIQMETGMIEILRAAVYIISFFTLIATKHVRKLALSGKGPPLTKYTSATIIALAMSESIGTYGLILFLIGKKELDLYLLVAVSGAAMLIYRPRR